MSLSAVETTLDVKLMIDGKQRDGSDGRTLSVLNPATEETIGIVAHAAASDIDEAAWAADKAFRSWRTTTAYERCKLLRAAAALLRERMGRIAPLLTLEQGKPLSEAEAEIRGSADFIDWLAEEGRRTYGVVVPGQLPNVRQITFREPIGPVATFTPWNFPINAVVRKVAAALAAGCTVVAKGNEETPASGAEVIQAFVDAGVPGGVVNLVYGDPAEISSSLIRHPAIRKLSFTGSTAVGKHLASLCGAHMKRTSMELGGHAPVIVTNDADIPNAIRLLSFQKYRAAGQICISPTRFLIQEEVYGAFLDGFVESARAIKVGNGFDPQTKMGPLANGRRVHALEEMVSDAVQRGAELEAGGHRIGKKGFFFEPTVIANVPATARVMNEEPFGPLAVVNSFATLDEAIEEANRLPYGLAAYAHTGSLKTAQELMARVEAGMLTLNQNGLSFPEVTFGGVKDSGYGSEGGPEAIEPYLVNRFVSLG